MNPSRAALRAVGALALALLAVAARAQPPAHGHEERRYGNPANLDSYIAHLADPARDAYQKPDAVVAALRLGPASVACDIGAGPGYFTLRLARAVGPKGFVYAVDVEPKILDALRERVGASGIRNIAPVLGLADDPLLPDETCDLVLIANTYHHFPEPPSYLRRLVRVLKPGGRLVNVDYHKRETPVGPPLGHRISREAFLEEARQAGLVVVEEPSFLPYHYFVILKPR